MMPIVLTGKHRVPLMLRVVAAHRLVSSLPWHRPARAKEQPPHGAPLPPTGKAALQPSAAATPAAPARPPAVPVGTGAGAANQRSTSRTKKLAPMGSSASLKS